MIWPILKGVFILWGVLCFVAAMALLTKEHPDIAPVLGVTAIGGFGGYLYHICKDDYDDEV